MVFAYRRFATHTFPFERLLSATALLALLFASAGAVAQRSYFKLYDQNQGLAAGEIGALAQDDQGFIWIGAHRGLLRFDGREFLRWAPQQFDEVVYDLIYGPDDQLLVRSASGRGLRRTAHGFDAVAGPDGAPLTALASFDFDARGRLWAVIDKQLWCRDRDLHWRRIESRFGGETARQLRALGDEVIVFTAQAAWRLRAGGEVQQLLRAPDLWFAAGGGKHPTWLASHFGQGLWRVDATGAMAMERPAGRALGLRERGDTLWLAMDRQLVAFEPDGRTRRMGIADGVPSGGPLLVDREQSLWLGTFAGLLQFPQPDTWQWNESEGLPLSHVHGIVVADGNVWAMTWAGLAHLARDGSHFIADSRVGNGGVCVAGDRGVWASDGARLLNWRADHFDTVGSLPVSWLGNCAEDSAGAWWLVSSAGLLRLGKDEAAPTLVRLEGPTADLIWTDLAGLPYVADDQSICRLRLTGDDKATRDDCRHLGAEVLNAVGRIDARRIWIAANSGLYEFDGEHASRLPGNRLLDGGVVSTLTPAADGGWWTAGAGILMHIRPCDGCAAGWEVIEALGQWQGLPGNSAIEAWETGTGDLWVAGNRGVWRVPASARIGPQHAPPVLLVHARIDAAEHAPDASLELAATAHRLDLEFAALSFRDRSLLRFRSRLAGQGDWSAPSRDPLLQFAALEPGYYRAEMAASLDGEHWSESAATIEFRILPPWYRTWWARLLFLAAALGLAAWIYRLRIAALLRVERERTRIAMDLHDELGTGLGSIGVLAGVAAREGLDSGERRRLANEIANLSGLLGSGLRSLVWSLRSGRAGVAELGAQIADHARRLFPDEKPRLTLRLPTDAADQSIPPEIRRNVLLLALEALHNVTRHSAASHVALALSSTDSGGLRLSVEDDGRGFDQTQAYAGAGLESMARRATAIGGVLQVDTAPGRGTRIVLEWAGGRRIA